MCYYKAIKCIVTYTYQSESTLYSCLNVKELLAQNMRDIWILSDSNEIRSHNQHSHSQHSSIIWPVWLNGWVFVYELSGRGFESRCCNYKAITLFKEVSQWENIVLLRILNHYLVLCIQSGQYLNNSRVWVCSFSRHLFSTV